jgi:hypothetical protein
MTTLNFDSSRFGKFFDEQLLDIIADDHALTISDSERIRLYKEGTLINWVAQKLDKTITVVVGSKTIICNKNSFFKRLHLKPDSSIEDIQNAFVKVVLANRGIEAEIAHKTKNSMRDQLASIVGWTNITGSKLQIGLFFDLLNATVTKASDDQIEQFIKRFQQPDGSYRIAAEAIILFVLDHFSPKTERLESSKALDFHSPDIKQFVKELNTIATTILPLQNRLMDELARAGKEFQALKITRKSTGLPVSLIVQADGAVYIKRRKHSAKGAFKKVNFPIAHATMAPAAFAVLHKPQRTESEIENLKSEARFHKQLKRCKNVVQGRLVQFNKWDPAGKKVEITSRIKYEYMNLGTLTDQFKNIGAYSKKDKLAIIVGMARGVNELHCHKKCIVHNDLKSDNILLHRNEKGELEAKIADLGLAEETADSKASLATFRGNALYASPEKTKEIDARSRLKDDVWSLGLLYYQIQHQGELPKPLQEANKKGSMNMLKSALQNPEVIRGSEPAKGSFDHLIWQMLDPDPQKRPTMDRVQQVIESFEIEELLLS